MDNRKKVKNTSKLIKKSYKDAYYNNSSVAYELQLAYYPEEEVRALPSLQPKRKTAKEPAIDKYSHIFHRIKLMIAVVVVFACCIITMVTYASIAEQRVKLENMKEKLSTLQNENTILQSKISGDMNLEYIEEQAKTRLGMSEPQAYQVVSIDVPKQSYTIQYSGEGSKQKEKTFIERFSDLFKKD